MTLKSEKEIRKEVAVLTDQIRKYRQSFLDGSEKVVEQLKQRKQALEWVLGEFKK